MGHVESESAGFHHSAGLFSLGFPLWGKGHVVPAGEEVQFIPRTLTVAEEDEISEHIAIVGPEGKPTEGRGQNKC